jgi:hypothetical protein
MTAVAAVLGVTIIVLSVLVPPAHAQVPAPPSAEPPGQPPAAPSAPNRALPPPSLPPGSPNTTLQPQDVRVIPSQSVVKLRPTDPIDIDDLRAQLSPDVTVTVDDTGTIIVSGPLTAEDTALLESLSDGSGPDNPAP